MDETLAQRIVQIHNTPTKLVFTFAGAGSLALAWLHAVAGSSRTILEASDHYASRSLADLLGGMPEKFVSQATAEAMASAAYHRAVRLGDDMVPIIGVGLTATIATDRVKRGDHGCWVAVQNRNSVRSYGLVLSKNARDRDGEEALVSTLAIRAIAEACGLIEPIHVALLDDERIDVIDTARLDPIALLLDGTANSVTISPDNTRAADAPVHGGLLSGSFNPLHQGHERLTKAAANMIGAPVAFEIPILNADKPPLPYPELERRLAQFRWRYPVVLSRAPLFVQKADLFPNCTFILGFDTAVRLLNLSYYGGENERDQAMNHIRARGCRFLVAGRVDNNGAFLTLDDLAIPPALRDMFTGLPEDAFRIDLSSTAIRASMERPMTDD